MASTSTSPLVSSLEQRLEIYEPWAWACLDVASKLKMEDWVLAGDTPKWSTTLLARRCLFPDAICYALFLLKRWSDSQVGRKPKLCLDFLAALAVADRVTSPGDVELSQWVEAVQDWPIFDGISEEILLKSILTLWEYLDKQVIDTPELVPVDDDIPVAFSGTAWWPMLPERFECFKTAIGWPATTERLPEWPDDGYLIRKLRACWQYSVWASHYRKKLYSVEECETVAVWEPLEEKEWMQDPTDIPIPRAATPEPAGDFYWDGFNEDDCMRASNPFDIVEYSYRMNRIEDDEDETPDFSLLEDLQMSWSASS